MIVFLNFAPIEFLGGVERQISKLFFLLNEKETTKIICSSRKLSNWYARLILKRNFDDHSDKTYDPVIKAATHLTLKHFIPFTMEWHNIRRLLLEARQIYVKFEVMELIMLFYFGGLDISKKSIAAVRSPIYYAFPISIIDKIHNYIYTKKMFLSILSCFKMIHVLNARDKNYLSKDLGLTNVVYIPNGIQDANKNLLDKKSEKNVLNVIFVGELSKRKGVDTLIDVIRISPKHFKFRIAGDGPLKMDLIKMSKVKSNCSYLGYIKGKELFKYYSESDVLLFTSRAETFGTVMIEAALYGCMIINSQLISLNLPNYIERSLNSYKTDLFLNELKNIFDVKNKIDRNRITSFIQGKYSETKIQRKLVHTLFNL